MSTTALATLTRTLAQNERAEFERLAAEQTQRDQQEVIAAMQGAQ